MSLDLAHRTFGWPSRDDIVNPSGVGAHIFAKLAAEKIGKAVSQLPDGDGVVVGVLASDPDATESPLAVVCEFPRPVATRTLMETQKLAWNFCRALLLITIEPHIIRKWTCCEQPVDYDEFVSDQVVTTLDFDGSATRLSGTPEIFPQVRFDPHTGDCLDELAAESLQWIELISGHFFLAEADRFRQDQRADRMLLSNLREVRARLRELSLVDRYSHDLLARIIFIQFLFDRKDSTHRAALNPEKLAELRAAGILSTSYLSFDDILSHYGDTYALFRWLNVRFNGDLFPGKGNTPEEREAEWQTEQQHVNEHHLQLLSEFVRGDMEMQSGQKCLWPQYAFDAIPLEFISSIYEEFVSGEDATGVHYTRDFLVDLMLDRVLPWNSEEWDVRILDPACGSGIFLVKAFQRLIYRWKLAHRDTGAEITPGVLRQILEHNLFGIDADPNAVRVASFSLYLAMCDEIDPRYYWSDERHVQFPILRYHRIAHSDFFKEDRAGFRTAEDAKSYDLIVGNPPWGDTTLTDAASQWAIDNDWPIANKDFGTLFIAKGMALTKAGGRVCLIQSASALLYNREDTAVRLRQRLFRDFKRVDGVINLAALRLFRNVRVPTCIFMIRNEEPNDDPFWYECPKPLRTSEDINRITIEANDVHPVFCSEVIDEPWLWSALMWGSNRDRALIRRLSKLKSLEKMRTQKLLLSREGVVRGNRKKKQEAIVGRRYFDAREFPTNQGYQIVASTLPVNDDPDTDSAASTELSAFASPQLLLKTSWTKALGRFQARIIVSEPNQSGVVCSQSYVSVRTQESDAELLKSACLVYNSLFAPYYLLLTSGRFAFDRAEPLVTELRSVPLPDTQERDEQFQIILGSFNTVDELDDAAFRLFNLKDAERILVEDLVQFTLPDYKGRSNSPGRLPTRRIQYLGDEEPELQAYCNTMCHVLTAGYGRDKPIGAVIFSEQAGAALPVRMVCVYLNSAEQVTTRVEPLQSSGLRQRLSQYYSQVSNRQDRPSAYHRCARSYSAQQVDGAPVLVVSLVKPDQVKYWTRSMALRDADDISADLAIWQRASSSAELHDQEEICG